MALADKQLEVLENKFEELNLSIHNEKAEGTVEALQQLEEERKGLDTSQRLLNELLDKSQEEALAKAAPRSHSGSTTITIGTQNSGFAAGIINGGVSGISFGGK